MFKRTANLSRRGSYIGKSRLGSDVHLEDWKHLWKHLWKVWKHNLLIKSFGLEASNQILYYWKHKMHITVFMEYRTFFYREVVPLP